MNYPPVNFHFSVHFGNLTDQDIAFQSVNGLSVQMQTETIKEAGENRFEHVVPIRTKASDLVLKRGLVYQNSPVLKWIQQAMENFIFDPVDITVKLLDEKHQPLVTWKVFHAWPKNWKMDELNAESGKVLIETIELSYTYFQMRK